MPILSLCLSLGVGKDSELAIGLVQGWEAGSTQAGADVRAQAWSTEADTACRGQLHHLTSTSISWISEASVLEESSHLTKPCAKECSQSS